MNLECVDHSNNRGIHSQATHRQGAQEVKHMPDVDGSLEHTTAGEAAHQSLDSTLLPQRLTCQGIKAFTCNGMSLNVVSQSKERGQRVGQVQQHGRGNDGDETEVVRYGSCNYERNSPPNRDNGSV